MADPLLNPGGHRNWDVNMRITSQSLDQVGEVSLQSLTSFLAWLFRDVANDAPPSGFPGSDCLVEVVSGTTIRVNKGVGFYYDSAETDSFSPHYKPIVVSEDTDEALSAPAADPRIDVVCLAPVMEEDSAGSERFKDPSTGSTGVQVYNERIRLSHTLQVVEGVAAATPSAPATPSGYVKIAEVLVEAGPTLTVTDYRPILTWGHAWAQDPGADYVQSFIPGSSTELEVTESSPAAMTVEVAAGVAVIRSSSGVRRYRFQADTVTIAAADPTNARIDIVYADHDGTLGVRQGAAAGVPLPPVLADGEVALARVAVAALASSIVTANITDQRKRGHLRADAVSAETLQDGIVSPTHEAMPVVIPSLVKASGGSGAPAVVDVAMLDGDGNSIARTVRCMAYVLSNTLAAPGGAWEIAETGAGAAVSTLSDKIVFDTDANGAAQLTVTNGSSGNDVFLFVEPLNTPGTPGVLIYGA